MVLDHTNRVAYAAKSHRADPLALKRFCATFGYEPMMFTAIELRTPTGRILVMSARGEASVTAGHWRPATSVQPSIASPSCSRSPESTSYW